MARGQGPSGDPNQTSKGIRTPTHLAAVVVGAVAGIITKSLAHSLSTQIVAAATAIAVLFLGQLFPHLKQIPKSSLPSLLLRSLQTLCLTFSVTIALVIFISRPAAPVDSGPKYTSPELVLINLSDSLSSIRAHYQLLLHSPNQASDVIKDATQLVEKIGYVNDANLGLDMQIFKYQSLAYSWGVVAGSEMISADEFHHDIKLKSAEEILNATKKAENLIDEAYRDQPVDAKLQATRDWIVKDDAEKRIQRLKAVALCFRWQLNQVADDRIQAKKLIDSLPAYYIAREHPERSYELAPCLNEHK